MSRHLFPPQGGTLKDAQKAAEAALMRQGFGIVVGCGWFGCTTIGVSNLVGYLQIYVGMYVHVL